MLFSHHGRLLAVAGFAVLLSSCVESDQPLSDPAASMPDPELYGMWQLQGEDANRFTEVMAVGRAAELRNGSGDIPPGLMRAVRVATGGPEHFVEGMEDKPFFVSKLGSKRFINRIEDQKFDVTQQGPVWNTRRISMYRLIRYEVSEDKLSVWIGDLHALAREVESGKLRGQVLRDTSKVVTSVRLRESTENLAKYFAGDGSAVIFPERGKIVYTRLPVQPRMP